REQSKSVRWDYPTRWRGELSENQSHVAPGSSPPFARAALRTPAAPRLEVFSRSSYADCLMENKFRAAITGELSALCLNNTQTGSSLQTHDTDGG
ncbi:hypothetical protein KUCAC02_027228, partial [Chaenocephalus aceratus]